MRLIVEGVSAKREAAYQKAFRFLVRHLNIENHDKTVWLTFFKKRPEMREMYRFGSLIGEQFNSEQGATRNEIVDNIIEMKINDYKSSAFSDKRERSVLQPPMQTFVHEMTHVAQMVTGRLVVRQTPFETRVRWNGRWGSLPPYEDQPWEHEAQDLTQMLYPMLCKHFGRSCQ